MAVALMSILVHPHPDIQPLKIEKPLAGLLLISAWLSFESQTQSFKDNNHRDIHMRNQMHQWADDFCNADERNNYSEPIKGDITWFKDMPVKKILNIFGSYEIFRDDIVAFGKLLEKAGFDVENVECPMQVHIDCVLDAGLGMEVGPMSTETWRWIETVF